MAFETPAPDDQEELLLSCRYGDLDDVRAYLDRFGPEAIADARDENGNTALHMAAANGHTDIIDILLPHSQAALLASQNSAGSTPLHWAAVNKHLSVAQALVRHPGGPGAALVDVKNAVGRTQLGEAELAGWDEGARWFVEIMDLGAEEGEVREDGAKDDEAPGPQDVMVEITDAEGGVAKMTLGCPPTESGK